MDLKETLTIDDLELTDVKENAGSYRCRHRKFFLTYPLTINKEKLLEHIKSLNKKTIQEYCIANEIGKTGHEHTHAYICYLHALEINTNSYFNFDGNHNHIKLIHSEIHRARVIKYLWKDDTNPLTNIEEVSRTFLEEFMIKKLLEKHNWSQVVLDPELTKWVSGHYNLSKDIFNSKKFKFKIDTEFEVWKLPYHDYIINILNEAPSYRCSYWFYETKGNMYKSLFTKWISNNYNTCIDNGSNEKDFIYKYSQQSCVQVVVFDLPRGKSTTFKDLSNILEGLKNGTTSNTKYNSNQVNFSCPHIIIFSNEKIPNIIKMSEDKLKIFKILSNGNLSNEIYKLPNIDDDIDPTEWVNS